MLELTIISKTDGCKLLRSV